MQNERQLVLLLEAFLWSKDLVSLVSVAWWQLCSGSVVASATTKHRRIDRKHYRTVTLSGVRLSMSRTLRGRGIVTVVTHKVSEATICHSRKGERHLAHADQRNSIAGIYVRLNTLIQELYMQLTIQRISEELEARLLKFTWCLWNCL